MVYRTEVIQKKLELLDRTLETLRKLRSTVRQEDLLGDREEQWKVERGLQIACQCVLDIGDHILAAQFSERADEYEEIIAGLFHHQVISEELANNLHGLGGFRNIIVHEYGDLDYTILYDRLQNGLTDFEEFIQAILRYLKGE